jgi:hypothetical protein
MGLGASLITFTPNTTMVSANVNGNFSAINGITSLPIPFLTFSSDNGIIQSAGDGSMLWNGGMGKNTYVDILDGRTSTTFINDPSNTNGVKFLIGGTNYVSVTDTNGVALTNAAKLSLLTGSISRVSYFSGAGTGTYSHGNGGIPTWIFCIQNVSGNDVFRVNSITSTTCTITQVGTTSFWAMAIAQ